MRDAEQLSRFARAVRGHRLDIGLTQSELAAESGVSVRTIRAVEQGRAARPQSLAKVAAAVGLTWPPAGPRVGVLGPLVVETGDGVVRWESREHIARLDAMLRERTTTVVITAIAGTAGVGKTALAVHWANRVRDRFPDGQLHLDLRGFAAQEPVRPIEALGRFLRALGVPLERVPSEVDECAAMYRSLLATRRVLVVLDNAADAEQVRPLLPSSPGSMALITSRDRLGGVTTHDGGERLALDAFSPVDALNALARSWDPWATAHAPRTPTAEPSAWRGGARRVAQRSRRCSGSGTGVGAGSVGHRADQRLRAPGTACSRRASRLSGTWSGRRWAPRPGSRPSAAATPRRCRNPSAWPPGRRPGPSSPAGAGSARRAAA